MICLVSGQPNAAHMSMLTYGELRARNAPRQHGNSMRGTSTVMRVLQEAVSLMAQMELHPMNRTLVGTITQTLHFGAQPVKAHLLNTGLEASSPVSTLLYILKKKFSVICKLNVLKEYLKNILTLNNEDIIG